MVDKRNSRTSSVGCSMGSVPITLDHHCGSRSIARARLHVDVATLLDQEVGRNSFTDSISATSEFL